jgi:hypothetical protein
MMAKMAEKYYYEEQMDTYNGNIMVLREDEQIFVVLKKLEELELKLY